ncbi:MAG TPA: thiol:disulfide interchange protein DsbA/DsbL [Steroidobacteraceae bacterium]
MNKPTLLLAALVLMLSGCSQEHTPAPAPATDNGAATSTAAPATAAGQPATPAPVNQAEGPSRDEAALERVAPLPATAQLPDGKWKTGVNYRPIVPAQSTDSGPGRVEVIEVFWYACAHCYALEPYLLSWLKTKPANVDFVRVPVMWNDVHRAHARLFYTLQALGKEDALHAKVLAAIFDQKNMLYVAGDADATQAAQVAFAKANGISEADFLKAYNSFSVQNNLQKASDIQTRYLVDGVPRIIVNGKYSTDVAMASGGKQEGAEDKLFALIDDLVNSEKRH